MGKIKGKNKVKKFIYILIFSLLICLFILTNSVISFFSSSTKTTVIGAIDEGYLADGEVDGGLLSDYNLTKLVKIEGSEEEGYYFTFPEEQVKEVLDMTLFEEDVRYRDWGTNDIDALMQFIEAEIFTGLPNISKDPENIETEGDKIQGAVKFKRQSFNKEIGDYEQEVQEDKITQSDTSQHIIAIDAGHGNPNEGQVTNNYDNIATSEEELNEGKAKYTRGNSGEDSEGNEYQEWELNQKVVDLVIEKLSSNPTMKVIQTGKDQPDYQRLQSAIDAGAEAYISVHFNEKNATRGTEVWASASEYKENGETVQLGDNTASIEFGTTLMNSISGQMNMGVSTSKVREYYQEIKSTLKTSEECGIPNVYVFGNSMAEDVLDELMKDDEQGLDDYAQGIVNGIYDYFDTIENTQEVGEVNSDINERFLTYTSPENFDNMINNGDPQVLDHFTLDEDMKMIVATWTYTDGGGTIFRKAAANEYTTKIKSYIMPYQYPLAFLQDTGAEEFAKELAKLSLNSDLIMTVFDNVTVDIDRTITTVTPQEQTSYKTTEETTLENGETSVTTTDRHNGDIISGTPTKNTVDVRTETSSVDLQLTEADAWCVKYEKFFTTEKNAGSFSTVGEIQREESAWISRGSDSQTETREDGTIVTHVQSTADRTITEIENQHRTVTYKFKENPNREPVLSGNTSKFVKLLREHTSTALTNLESDNAEGLITILSSRASTANMVELTKWLLQETSKSIYFGLVKYEFEEFDPDNFTSALTGVSSSNIILDYLKSWENGTLWSYVKGDIGYSDYVAKYITQDKTQYVCFTDGDGRLNFGYGMCHYYNGHFNHVELYQSLGVDITQYNQVGMTLDVEIVDKAKLQFVEGVRQSVNAKLANAGIELESYQIDALIAIAYQWGDHIIDDFIPAYQQYGDTEELRQNFVNSNDPSDIPFLNGNGSSGSSYEVQRANANWTLFHEGRYLTPSGEELNPSDYVTTGGGVGQLVEQNSNGIYGTYTASSGKTFIEYRQCAGPWGTPPWASVPYWDGTISSSGCGPTSAAIALTGYGVNVTPEDTANAISNRYGSATQTDPETLTWVVNNFGVSAHTDGWSNVTSEKIANNLRQGRPVLISVGTSPDTMFTSGGHLMALIDIDGSDNVYVSNPSTTAHGWIPLSTVIQYCSYKWAVYFDE